MLIKWGALVVDGRGKIGGQVASKNRTGAYMRNKVTPVNAQTSFQMAARQELGSLSSAWSELTQSQRDAWNGAVENYQKTNIFGDQVKPTGKNLFTGLNRNLKNVDEAQIDVPSSPVEFPVIEFNELTVSTSAVTADISPEVIPAGFTPLWFATAPQSPGKSFVKSEYRMIGTTEAPDGPEGWDLTSIYTARFGNPVAGQKVFVKMVLVSTGSGQKGVPVEANAIVS